MSKKYYNQKEIAEQVGASASYVSKVKNNKVPETDTTEQIRALLNLDSNFIQPMVINENMIDILDYAIKAPNKHIPAALKEHAVKLKLTILALMK